MNCNICSAWCNPKSRQLASVARTVTLLRFQGTTTSSCVSIAPRIVQKINMAIKTWWGRQLREGGRKTSQTQLKGFVLSFFSLFLQNFSRGFCRSVHTDRWVHSGAVRTSEFSEWPLLSLYASWSGEGRLSTLLLLFWTLAFVLFLIYNFCLWYISVSSQINCLIGQQLCARFCKLSFNESNMIDSML